MSTQNPSGPLISALRFAAVPTAVGCARAFVRQTLHTWQRSHVADAAVLVTSELVTNAVKATGTTDPNPTYAALAIVPVIRVRLRLRGSTLVIEVWDVSPQPPVLRQRSRNAEHGRGLLIVHAQSERWGTTIFPKTGGKVVWAEIALHKAEVPPATRPGLSVPVTPPTSREPSVIAGV